MMKVVLLLILQFAMLFLAIHPVVGQENGRVSRRAVKMYNRADEAYQTVDLQNCLELSTDLVSAYPSFDKAWLLLGKCADELGNNELALSAYRKFFSIDSLSIPDIALRITELYIGMGSYLNASATLAAFKRISKNPLSSSKKKLVHLDKQLAFAIRQVNKYSGKPVIQSVDSINTINEEYFPSLTVDGRMLFFTRQEVDTELKGNISQEDLYSASLGPNGIKMLTKLPPPLNTNNNEGTQTIRQDGRLMLFTACNRPDSKGGCDIYSSYKIQEAWSAPENLGYPVNTRYWESTPSLGPDGRTLYFASNRPGGYGGMDIWYSHFDSDSGWEDPINLGPSINTAGNEMSPFLHGDGMSLYFSSSGWIGMGGLDLFLSRLNDSLLWSYPINLGYPINTFSDDFGITIAGEGVVAYFSSNRDSVMNRDIYKVELEDIIRPNAIGYVKGKIVDSKTKRPIGAWVKVTSRGGDVYQNVEADPVSGDYLVGLAVNRQAIFVVSQPGYLYYSASVPVDSVRASKSYTWDIKLDPVEKGKSKILKHLFFAFDSAEISSDSEAEIIELYEFMRSNSGTQIEISGHTDSWGSDDYNRKLSQKRADALMKRLIKLGIDSNRITAFGAGSSKPLEKNSTEKGRAINRRTEIRIVKSN